LHVIPHGALGQIGEGAEIIKTESSGHGFILTLKLFKSSVNKIIGVRATLISNPKGESLRGASSYWGTRNRSAL
jgi:hypothetical protein